jgi:hypothetical protein
MKLIVNCVVAAMLTLIASVVVSAQVVTPPFSVTINAPHMVVVGSELRLSISYTNTSNQLISLPRSNGDTEDELYTDVDVRIDNSNPAPETPYRRSLREGGMARSDVLVSLEPGKTAKDQIIVTKLYNLQPGRYRIQVSRITPPWMERGVVKSNVISVVVSPKGG